MQLNSATTGFKKCSDVTIPQSFYERMSTGIKEVDLIFGSEKFPGLMPGSAITICGQGGSGKTTALTQILQLLVVKGHEVAYATGEESQVQLSYTCNRLGITDIHIAHTTCVEEIAESMKQYKVMIVDSFQALRSTDKKMGKMKFLQYAQDLLISAAKDTGCILIFVLHTTTTGLSKGGTDMTHAVDMNIKLMVDPIDNTKRIFDVYKNRFGDTNKHTFPMTEKGFVFHRAVPPPLPQKTISIEPKSKDILGNLSKYRDILRTGKKIWKML